MIDINTYSKAGIDQSLNHILEYVRILTKSDAGTIYLKEDNFLRFMVFQNDSISKNDFISQHIDLTSMKLSLENNDKNLVAVNSFLNNTMINVEDVYKDVRYNFGGTKSFDVLFHYKTHSILTVPLIHPFEKTPIGVLQIINKKGIQNLPSKFTKEDELFLEFVSGFVSLSIINVQKYVSSVQLENAELLIKIEEEFQENSKKNVIINHEYQMSQIHKVLQNIAHQWRHPLGELSLNNIFLHQIVEDVKVQKIIEDNEKIIQNLSQTINSFEGIFEQSVERSFFDVSIWIRKGLNLVNDYIKTYKIQTELSIEKALFLYGYPSVFSQIILAILENIVDIFRKLKSENQLIAIRSFEKNGQVIIEIEDSVGLHHLKKVPFDIKVLQLLTEEKFGGNLLCEHQEKGRKFTFSLPNMQLLRSQND